TSATRSGRARKPSMSRPDDVRIRHMVDAAEKAVAFANGRSRDDLDSDEMPRFALVKLVEIVGEAAKQVTAEARSEYPGVAWAEASRMRDRLVHHYFSTNPLFLWAAGFGDLSSLFPT